MAGTARTSEGEQRQAQIGRKSRKQAKQHPVVELLLFENYSLSLSTLPLKMIGDILKNVRKTSPFVLMKLYD